MTEILSALIAWVEWVITEAGYPGLVLAMLLETVFPPIPSEAILPFAGVLTRRGVFDLWGVVIAATIGSVAGAGLLYALGRWVEDHILITAVRRYGRWIGLTEAALERALNAFERHGWVAVFLGRLLPGLRSFISIPAGMARMKLSTFLAATTLGSALWNTVFAALGWALGDHWESALHWLALYEEAILLVAAGLVVIYALWRLTRRATDTGAPPSAPA
ncbi:MAG: DedA family protein [Anaerolineales bacterium]|nr:DedA family protein [Anaerolineales bacterium]